MATLTELDILRIEHQLLSDLNLMTVAGSEAIRDVFMQSVGITAMAYELLEKLNQKENGDGK